MHAFFALPFDMNSYKDVYFLALRQNSIIVSLLCLELDEVAVDHIQETFGNLILSLSELTKLVCLFDYILLCSNLFGDIF